MIRAAALCVLVLPTAAAHAQQRDFSAVEVTSEKVAEGVYVLKGAGGNIGVSVGPEAVFLVDDQYAPLTPRIQKAVAALTDKPIRFVLNTHWHGDHTGGNENLGQAGALIVAHDNVRVRMSAEQFLEAFGTRVPPSPAQALPVVTFNDTVTLHLNGHDIHAFHLPPAHTDGDSVVHFRAPDVLHTGDLFFNGMYPFIDTSSGGSIDGMIAAADRLLALCRPGTRIIPGHGPVAGRAELQAFRDMLAGARAKVAELVAAGRTAEEAAAANPLAEFDARWGKGFLDSARFVSILHRDLSRRARR